MKQNPIILAVIVVLIAFTSCSKDSTTAGTDITGNYKFVSSQVKATSTVQSISGSYILRTVTTSNYTTQNNTGTVVIDAAKLTSSNLSYSVNTTAKSTIYENGVVSDTFSFPFQFTLPPSSGVSNYKKISADSLYFTSGSFLTAGSTSAAQPAGAKIKYENGRLTLSASAIQSTTTTDQGETVISVVNATAVTVLQKQ